MQLVILIGLQASGKSTFYRERFARTHAYVSRDQFRRTANPPRRQKDLIDTALADGRDVVVDNTSPRVADRAPIIRQAKSFGAEVVGYFFEPDVQGSIARNRQRPPAQRVPDVAIYVTAKRLVRPSLAEGFDELFSVRSAADNNFVLTPLAQTGRIEPGG
jgi:predicted kinase